MTGVNDATSKTLRVLPPKLRKSVSSSPTSTMRLTIQRGAQNEGKERAAALPGQYTGSKAKRDDVMANGDSGEEGVSGGCHFSDVK